MKKQTRCLVLLLLVLSLFCPAAPAAAEGDRGEADPEHGFSGCPLYDGPAFTWKSLRMKFSYMTTDLEEHGLGDLQDEGMLLVRLEAEEGTVPYDAFHQRLFALVNSDGEATLCKFYIVSDISLSAVAAPSDGQQYIDLLFDPGDVRVTDPAEAWIAVYEERNGPPACLVSLAAVPRETDRPSWTEVHGGAQPGDIVAFGRYEQDNDTENGPEEIRWQVLAKEEDGTLFLISEQALDYQPYEQGVREVTWEDCTLRGWLNGEFLNAAFTEQEQGAIAISRLKNDGQGSSEFSSRCGAETEDRVFLLSYSEFRSKLSEKARVCTTTAYTRAEGAKSKKNAGCVWWLRSPGKIQISGALISADGTLFTGNTFDVWNCVRPAIRVDEKAVTRIPDPDVPDETPYNTCHVLTQFGHSGQQTGENPEDDSLEWIILEIRDGKALALSRHILKEGSYTRFRVHRVQNWADSLIRCCLIHYFPARIFTQAEYEAIAVSEVDNDAEQNPPKYRECGDENPTYDRLFILSSTEAMDYLAAPVYRTCTTREDYPEAKRAKEDAAKNLLHGWWLRSNGDSNSYAYLMMSPGTNAGIANSYDSFSGIGIRPAFRLNLKAPQFTYRFSTELPESGWERQEEAQPAETGEEPPALCDRAAVLQPGDIVTFGHFEQTGKTSDGTEAIEWIVLEVSEGKALLISRYGLTRRAYSANRNQYPVWEKSDIRKWLNKEFLQQAFTAEERMAVLTTEVDNGAEQGNSAWQVLGSRNTQDRVFLLSYAEISRYFPTDTLRRCAYAETVYLEKNNGGYCYYTEEGNPSGDWWIRGMNQSTLYNTGYNYLVDSGGDFSFDATDKGILVRPAIRVTLDPDVVERGLDRRITVEDGPYVIYAGKTLKIGAEVTPLSEDAPKKTTLVWHSSDETVVKVSGGSIRGVSAGRATVTVQAKDNEKIAGTVDVEVRTPVRSVSLDVKELKLLFGAGAENAAAALSVTVTPGNAYHQGVTWSSSDETVATVDAAGMVTAVSPGKAVITAVSDDPSVKASAACRVTVSQAVTEIVPVQESFSVSLGKTAEIRVTVLPSAAPNRKVAWSSSDEAVATVSASGKVKGVSAGTAVITVSALDGSGVTATVTVTVEDPSGQ